MTSTKLIEIYILLSLLFNTTHSCDSSCEIYLSNTDFEQGSFRIREAGIYCLKQDIVFNPQPSSISNPNGKFGWFPKNEFTYPGCKKFTGGPYSLGWFTVIAIETDDVEINLCGYQISQSLQFSFQQPWFNIIEIAKAAFEKGSGPTDFGGVQLIQNIYIHNGKLGLSTHNAIHSNSARNVRLEDLEIFDFEVAGIQFNGASNIIVKNIEIGPSNDNVKASPYYSNARYTALAMRLLLDKIRYNPNHKYITFSGGRKMSLQQVFTNLITSMDIGFRYFLNANTRSDRNHHLFETSVDLYFNKFGLPTGSAMYGILLHSFNWAIFGLGQQRSDKFDGEQIVIENVKIRNLKLHTKEFPHIYFDECNDINSDTQTFIKGPFGDTMDIRMMVDKKYRKVIDNGGDITPLKYKGNPLDDARIALAIFGAEYDLQFGSVTLDNKYFFAWTLDSYEGISYDTLPQCASFVCNADIMFHNNKGIMGIRADLIDDFEMNNVEIRKLINKTPLNSFACGPYEGPNDGGHPTQLQGWGGLGTSVKGLSIYGGDVLISNNFIIANLKSNYGDIVGIHLFHNAIVLFDDTSHTTIRNLFTCKSLTKNDIHTLIKTGKYPYPNDCFACNVLLDPMDMDNIFMDPNPPNGIHKLYCYDTNNKQTRLPKSRTKYEPKKEKLIYYDKQINLNKAKLSMRS